MDLAPQHHAAAPLYFLSGSDDRIRMAGDRPCRRKSSRNSRSRIKKIGKDDFVFPDFWCGRQELNLHGVTHKILSLARLPVPPRPHIPLSAPARDPSSLTAFISYNIQNQKSSFNRGKIHKFSEKRRFFSDSVPFPGRGYRKELSRLGNNGDRAAIDARSLRPRCRRRLPWFPQSVPKDMQDTGSRAWCCMLLP